MKARHFFEVWVESVRTVAADRSPTGIPMALGEDIFRTNLEKRHGSYAAEQGVAYLRRLANDTRALSAKGGSP